MKDISLVMIVKNEEALLPRCLSSVNDLVSEIVIVDTGSSDSTIEIAKEFGARIFSFKWDDDFSAARNFTLSKIKFEMALHLDADEYLPSETRKLIEELDPASGDIYRFDLFEESGEFLAHFPRLFRRSSVAGYKGRIHETLDILPGARIADLPAPIIHSGYSQSEIGSKNKAQRNLHLLELALKDDPNDQRTIYLYAREMDRRSDEQAGIYYQKALNSGQGSQDLYKFFGTFLAKRGQWSKALEVIESGLQLHPGNNELQYFQGLVLLDLKEFDKAIDAFTRSAGGEASLNEKIGPGDNFVVQGERVFRRTIPLNLIWRGIGIAQRERGDAKASVKSFARALKTDAEDEFAKQAIRELLGSHLSVSEIEAFIGDILA